MLAAVARSGALLAAAAVCMAGIVALGMSLGGTLAWATLRLFEGHEAAIPASYFIGVTSGVGSSIFVSTTLMLTCDAVAMCVASTIGATWGAICTGTLIIYKFDGLLTILGVAAMALSAAGAVPITCLCAYHLRQWGRILPLAHRATSAIRTAVFV